MVFSTYHEYKHIPLLCAECVFLFSGSLLSGQEVLVAAESEIPVHFSETVEAREQIEL